MPTISAAANDSLPVTSSASSSLIKPAGKPLASSPIAVNSSILSDGVKPEESASKKVELSGEDMRFYYERLLPFRYVFQWLNHSPKPQPDFTMREFAYEHRSGAYQRYNSFESLENFKQSVVRANPMRFEVGPVYAINPSKRKSVPKSAMKALEKELVFDIDLTDYDEIRTCCSKTKICTKCWRFITAATKVLDAALREDFGFEHMIWVFSGRRGAHCWISDKRARMLDEPKRRAIVEYLDVLKTKGSKRLNLRRPLHPHIERSLTMLKPDFITIIQEQDPWRDDEVATQELLSKIPVQTLVDDIKKMWKTKPRRSSLDKFKDISEMAQRLPKPFEKKMVIEAAEDMILEMVYPRLDVEVTRQMIHLLKSPFCIHPGTGNICVPFDASWDFNPMEAPNLHQIQKELIDYDSNNTENSERKIANWDKTSLKPYTDFFADFVKELLKSERNGKRERDDNEEDLEF
ncbi:DNA primase small subunit [Cyberlindnera fabianii]|uniref:DNA primase n=1 Tax=Cyberlindnera fabianii TaxID=36022 RepID=A0A1V2L196_CYBFA|nr:DNA primase small subunit [Cyberlindnera fabianii]